MARNPACTVYIGNLDERVTERVLYEILIQVGRIVDLHIPRDKDSNRHKGYAFAEYESEEIADYAVRLFSGLVRLYNRTLKFAISGQDKPSQNGGTPVTPKPSSPPVPKSHTVHCSNTDVSRNSAQSVVSWRVSAHSATPSYSHGEVDRYQLINGAASSDRLANRAFSNGSYNHTRGVFGSMLSDVNRQAVRQPITYPLY